MIELELDARGMGSLRFAISQSHILVDSLMMLRACAPAGTREWIQPLRYALTSRRLNVVRALFCGPADYIPDFTAPHPPTYERSFDECLHAIATASPEQVREEMGLVLDQTRESGREVPQPLLRALDGGEQAFAEAAAAELAQVWRISLADRWPGLRALSEADIAYRSQRITQIGMAATLTGLTRDVDYAAGRLRVAARADVRVREVGDLVLLPRVFGQRGGVDITHGPGDVRAAVWYRMRPVGTSRDARPSPACDLVGPTRAALLADLSVPRSTSELAHCHGLSPSTVSYHLAVLHRSGLVTKIRDARSVMYRQTHRATQLLGE
ncbi:ArsR/SmtB family transcription factor [Actinacidiphila paucisporea]|uniref:Helix-turn-helix domain-containing protein n=1 Tax=Actinacidiphila paucisporea TaxID=310782 RepID=A0A1M6YPI5_9ACTN|nr:helix-turn-helix domain-containing protein [Actinacidiphila paucisporea]SHL20013.1 Helix-turn-helix domain-containing protein [Actinacidiphila paucisporea]